MKSINIKKLKPGDIILAFDSNLKSWTKCKIIRIGTYRITLEYIKGSVKGIPWYETISKIGNPEYYRMAG
ncbi:hypothetical protein ES705_16516 [subsurface metagenome]|jgi:hypothetical protein